VYLCERDAGLTPPRTWDLFYHDQRVSNQQLKRMWDRTLRFHPLAGYAAQICRRTGVRKPLVDSESGDRDVHGLLGTSEPHLRFTEEELDRGRTELQRLGIPETDRFVCFIARDSRYLEEILPEKDCSYHDYRDSDVRNHVAGLKTLTDRGYWLLRMGALVRDAIDSSDPRIIDYATEHRTEFMDIFLCAHCDFFIGDPCGLNSIPVVFRRPQVTVNMIPLEYAPTWGPPNYLFVPKKLWLIGERRFLTFREILASDLGRCTNGHRYRDLGIEPVENTSAEIAAVAVEMAATLRGQCQPSAEDDDLQNRFWSLYRTSDLNHRFKTRIGTQFLRENQELLGD